MALKNAAERDQQDDHPERRLQGWRRNRGRGVPARLRGHTTHARARGHLDAGQPHADQVQESRHHAGQHHRQELAQHDLGAGRRADQQGLHRAPLFLAGAEINGRVKGARERHDHQQERKDPAPDVALNLLRCGHVHTLDLDRLRIALGQLVLPPPLVHDPALPAVEHFPAAGR